MIAEALLRHLTLDHVKAEIAKHGVEHLVEVEETDHGILVRVPAAIRLSAPEPVAPELSVTLDAPTPPAPPKKIIATTITDGDLATAEREMGKPPRFGTRHTLTVEVPEHYDEDAITPAAIAADPAISIVARVPQLVPAAEPAPVAAPAATPSAMPSPVELEPVAPKAPTKIVHTAIADEQGRLLTVEMPEDYEEDELTPESIAADPAISIVSRSAPQAPVETAAPAATSEAPISMPAPVALEPVTRAATKIVHTNIADGTGKLYVIEVPEDLDASALTAEDITSNPGISIVARVTPPAPEEPAAEMPPADSAPPAGDSAPPAETPPAADKPADVPGEITMPEGVVPDNGAAPTVDTGAPAATTPDPEASQS